MRIAIVFIICILFGDCSTHKSAVRKETKTDTLKVFSNTERDSVRIEVKVDTASECKQSIIYERIEYYPTCNAQEMADSYTYPTRNVCENAKSYTDEGTPKQMVKSVTRYSKQSVNKTTGTATAVVKEGSEQAVSDSAKVSTSESSEVTAKSRMMVKLLWWLIVMALLLLAIVAFIKAKDDIE